MASCVPFDIDSACCDGWDELDEALRERASELAWSTLRTLSGGQLGNCPAVVRPCLGEPCNPCSQWWHQSPWVGVGLVAGQWVNCICGGPTCSCAPLCEIVMPGPVAAILKVDLGGSELPLGDFRVDNTNRIVRMDGGCWPSCQDMTQPQGAPGTLSITYLPGIVPDGSALWAAGVLACEYVKACSGGKCRLPAAVTTISRQGVAFNMSTAMFPDGMTGIREVDAFLTTVNPHGLKVPPMVWSPDVPWVKHRYETPQVEVVP